MTDRRHLRDDFGSSDDRTGRPDAPQVKGAISAAVRARAA